jgi:hypothetical protein
MTDHKFIDHATVRAVKDLSSVLFLEVKHDSLLPFREQSLGTVEIEIGRLLQIRDQEQRKHKLIINRELS